jgi:membrane protein implicated in regulation of membrane protease activity
MSDKPIAMLVTAAVVAPICSVCVLGPAAVGSGLAWMFGWAAGLPSVLNAGLAVIGAILVYGLIKRRRARTAMCEAATAGDGRVSQPALRGEGE